MNTGKLTDTEIIGGQEPIGVTIPPLRISAPASTWREITPERAMQLYDAAIAKGGSADNIILNTVWAALTEVKQPFAARELDVEAERRDFEAQTALDDYRPLRRNTEAGNYTSVVVETCWNVWLAARSAAQGTAPEPVDESVTAEEFEPIRLGEDAYKDMQPYFKAIRKAAVGLEYATAVGELIAWMNDRINKAERAGREAARPESAPVSTEQAGDAPGRGPRYTCIGKGGDYELIGEARGAGKAKLIEPLAIYRDTSNGCLFFRTTDDFNERMAPSPNNSPVGAAKSGD